MCLVRVHVYTGTCTVAAGRSHIHFLERMYVQQPAVSGYGSGSCVACLSTRHECKDKHEFYVCFEDFMPPSGMKCAE